MKPVARTYSTKPPENQSSDSGFNQYPADKKPLPKIETGPHGDFGELTVEIVGPGFQLFEPSVTSALTFRCSRGAHNELSRVGTCPMCIVSFCMFRRPEVLRGLAKMVEFEFIAEEKTLRDALHDAGVRTVEEQPFPLPNPRPGGLVLYCVSTST